GVRVEPVTDPEVRAVVAEERRLDPRAVADLCEQVAEEGEALVLVRFLRRVVAREQAAGSTPGVDELRPERIVELPHPPPFAATSTKTLIPSPLSSASIISR